MTEPPRTVGSYSRALVIQQIVAVAVLIALLYFVIPTNGSPFLPVLVGTAIYLVWSRLAPLLFLRHHRTGIQFLRARAYAQALNPFEQSYAFFSRYPWLDRFRWLTLLTPSAISYREMALNNIGYAYLQLNKFDKAREYYDRLVTQFPAALTADAARDVIERIDKRGRK